MSVIQNLFSWDLIRAMNSVWEAHHTAIPMFNEDDYTDHEIATIATNREALLVHGGKRVVNEMDEIIAHVGLQAVLDLLERDVKERRYLIQKRIDEISMITLHDRQNHAEITVPGDVIKRCIMSIVMLEVQH